MSESELITPAEYMQRMWVKESERKEGDLIAWYCGDTVDRVYMNDGECCIVTDDRSGYGHRYVESQYTECLRIERIDYAAWRAELHAAIDALQDDELLYELWSSRE